MVGNVCVSGASRHAPLPQQLGLRRLGVRRTKSGGNSLPPLSTQGWVDVVRSGRCGGLDCGASARTALPAPQFPHLERNTQGLGEGRLWDPRASEVRLLSSRPFRLLSPLLCPVGPCGSGAGLEAGASNVEVNTARLSWRHSQKELRTRMRPLTSGPRPSSLGFQETHLHLRSSEETESVPKFAVGETEASLDRVRAATPWRMRTEARERWGARGRPITQLL